MKKPTLVLVHSFPTNHIILKGLIDYLKRYFVVHYIDLPGFINDIPPLSSVSIKNYARYLEKKIKKAGIKKYWLAGISFGFIVANNVHDEDCLGIVAIEPYINADFLMLPKRKKILLRMILDIMSRLSFEDTLLTHKSLKRLLRYGLLSEDYPADQLHTMKATINPRALIETGELILKNKKRPIFQDKPYVLIINKKDTIVNSKLILQLFSKRVKKLIVIETTCAHFPSEIIPEYFDSHINKSDMNALIKYMRIVR